MFVHVENMVLSDCVSTGWCFIYLLIDYQKIFKYKSLDILQAYSKRFLYFNENYENKNEIP